MCKKVVCFDLDDTLYKEIDYLTSAYGEIAASVGHPELVPQMVKWYRTGENVFQKLNQFLCIDTPIETFLKIYREHYPTITLSDGVEKTLNELRQRGVVLGLITDGRSVGQRNKIKALELNRWFDDENIIISEEFGSEKTDEKNFKYFEQKYPEHSFVYVGDNPKKDFIVPNLLGWQTIMLKDDGRNIHLQEAVPMENLPQVIITNYEDIWGLFK
jgi:putative hydrolase of the HAD superfamily